MSGKRLADRRMPLSRALVLNFSPLHLPERQVKKILNKRRKHFQGKSFSSGVCSGILERYSGCETGRQNRAESFTAFGSVFAKPSRLLNL
jgi:hypothetical protein